MEQNKEMDEVIRKIKALYDKANSTDSVDEAAAFTDGANRLLMKYNLDMHQIDMRTEAEKRKVNIMEDWHHLGTEQKRHESEWVHKLYLCIAKYNLCRAYSYGIGNSGVNYDPGTVLIVGEPFNVELVKFIVEQVISKVRIIESRTWNTYNGETKRNSFKRGFFDGAVLGIEHKLYEERIELERKAREQASEANQIMAMVHIKKNDVDEYLRERNRRVQEENQKHIAELKSTMTAKEIAKWDKDRAKEAERRANLKGRNTELKADDAKGKGFEAGRNISINKGLNNNQTSGQIN